MLVEASTGVNGTDSCDDMPQILSHRSDCGQQSKLLGQGPKALKVACSDFDIFHDLEEML